jgi:hypothetical protein
MATKISADKLAVARARLIAAVGHDVEWRTFARWAGVSPHTLSGILNGRSHGSPHTLERIVAMLRKRGVPILTDDLVESSGDLIVA